MKKLAPLNFFILVSTMTCLLFSCRSGNKVVSSIGKRKYTKGYFFNSKAKMPITVASKIMKQRPVKGISSNSTPQAQLNPGSFKLVPPINSIDNYAKVPSHAVKGNNIPLPDSNRNQNRNKSLNNSKGSGDYVGTSAQKTGNSDLDTYRTLAIVTFVLSIIIGLIAIIVFVSSLITGVVSVGALGILLLAVALKVACIVFCVLAMKDGENQGLIAVLILDILL